MADVGIALTPEDLIEEVVFRLEVQRPDARLFAEFGEHLRRLGTQPALLAEPLASLPGTGSTIRILAQAGTGPTLLLARFDEEPGPVHDHGSWGVVHVLSGTARLTHWLRLDAGLERGQARIRSLGDRLLRAGEVAWFGEPPDDIVSQQGVGGDVYELVLFGHNPTRGRRTRYDPATGEVHRWGSPV
ncbi:MAG TPA: hypothetical protein VF763_08100 [Candidatus Limnocylindrales bacterium]